MNTVFHGALAACGCFLASVSVYGQLTFSGSVPPPVDPILDNSNIPDSTGAGPGAWGPPLQVSFNVSGLTAAIADLTLSVTFRHAYVGDLEVLLTPPAGGNAFTIFSGVGQAVHADGDPNGSAYHFSADPDGNNPGTYVFSDKAVGNLWAAAGFNFQTGVVSYDAVSLAVPTGSYRTSIAGPWDLSGNPNGGNHNAGQITSFATDSGFYSLTPAQINGTWILQFRDGTAGDTGLVTEADLTITPVPEPAAWSFLFGIGLIGFVGCHRARKAFQLAKPGLTLL